MYVKKQATALKQLKLTGHVKLAMFCGNTTEYN